MTFFLNPRVILRVAPGRSPVAEEAHQILHLEQGLAVQAGAEDGLRAFQVEGIVPIGPAEIRQAVPPQVPRREGQGPVQMLENRAGLGLPRSLFIVGDVLLEEGDVAGLLDVLDYGQDVPEVVVAVEVLIRSGMALSDGSLHGQRVELVHG